MTNTRIDKPSDSFFTPNWLVQEVLTFYGGSIDLDPCAPVETKHRLPAKQYYTFEDNGLLSHWTGNVYCNPPYSNTVSTSIERWIHKALVAHTYRQTEQTLLLLPASTGTKWGQLLLAKDWEGSRSDITLLFFAKRISFLNSSLPPSKNTGRFSSMMVYLGRKKTKFRQQFTKFGVII